MGSRRYCQGHNALLLGHFYFPQFEPVQCLIHNEHSKVWWLAKVFFNNCIMVFEVFLNKLVLPKDLTHQRPSHNNPIARSSLSFLAMSVAAILLLVINNYPLWEKVGQWCETVSMFRSLESKDLGSVKCLSVQVTSSGAMFSLSWDEGVGPIGAWRLFHLYSLINESFIWHLGYMYSHLDFWLVGGWNWVSLASFQVSTQSAHRMPFTNADLLVAFARESLTLVVYLNVPIFCVWFP